MDHPSGNIDAANDAAEAHAKAEEPFARFDSDSSGGVNYVRQQQWPWSAHEGRGLAAGWSAAHLMDIGS